MFDGWPVSVLPPGPTRQLYKPGKSVGEHHYSSEPTVGSVCSNSTNNHEQVLGRFRKSKN